MKQHIVYFSNPISTVFEYWRLKTYCFGDLSCGNFYDVTGDGITTFGAKLVTITVFVIHAFSQVHVLWLYTYKDGKCNFNRQEHSTVFSVGYPYFLRVTLCLIPDFVCLAGLIHIVWIRICRRPVERLPSAPLEKSNTVLSTNLNSKTQKGHFPWDDSSYSGGRTLFVSKCRSCVIRIQIGKKTSKTFTENEQNNGFSGSMKRSEAEYDPIMVVDKTHSDYIRLISQPRADLCMAVTLAFSLLTFTVPQDIEWLSLYKMGYHGDNDFVKNFQLIKIAELIKQLSDCWYLLGWALFMPLLLLSNPSVRAQFSQLYCQRIRCRPGHCRLCYCGYYCDTEDNRAFQQNEQKDDLDTPQTAYDFNEVS
ncbi:hypothetical protein FGIG_06346 [Fasciola gigantica]|uniref:Uncharacterized protein n=1 Tax=Fasciola gigantica TaxID=46835 RepID=A0A504YFS0_FASGI|nr:hypothetical protein FGIG_06346 [Fasciola gigantica]